MTFLLTKTNNFLPKLASFVNTVMVQVAVYAYVCIIIYVYDIYVIWFAYSEDKRQGRFVGGTTWQTSQNSYPPYDICIFYYHLAEFDLNVMVGLSALH